MAGRDSSNVIGFVQPAQVISVATVPHLIKRWMAFDRKEVSATEDCGEGFIAIEELKVTR